jgi:hydroxymethylpyrimidine pyrophosphatase-like HAD family hydrolase
MSVYDTGLIRMDIYRKGFTKGTAVRHMIEKLGFNLEDSYAFGDGENDMQMLQLVGHGVAMGNAVPQLKKVAKEFTDSVLEEGIANYFTKNGLCL